MTSSGLHLAEIKTRIKTLSSSFFTLAWNHETNSLYYVVAGGCFILSNQAHLLTNIKKLK